MIEVFFKCERLGEFHFSNWFLVFCPRLNKNNFSLNLDVKTYSQECWKLKGQGWVESARMLGVGT